MMTHPRLLVLLLVGLSGCGDDGAAAPDAAPDAADVDAAAVDAVPPDAAPPQPVTVRAHDGATGIAGLPVAFLAADDTVVAVTTTDADGLASALVPDGGQVVLASDDRSYVLLWQGVAGGDALDAFFDDYDAMTVVLPEGPTPGGYYEVQTPCGGGGGGSATVSLSFLRRGCTSADVVGLWSDGAGQRRSLYVTGQPLVAGTSLDLAAQSWTPHVARSMTFTGVVAAEQTIVDVDLQVGAHLTVGGPANNVLGASGDVEIAGAVADIPGGLLRATIAQLRAGRAFAVTHVGPVTETTFAPGPHWLREVGTAAYDAPSRTVSWSTGATGQVEDGVEVWLSVDLPPDEGVDVFWAIVAPAGASVRVPALPPELAAVDPAAGTVGQPITVRSYALPDGPAGLRARLFGRYGWMLLDGAGTMATANNRGYL